MSNVTTTFPPHVPAYVESPKALSLVLYSSLCTHFLSVHLFHFKTANLLTLNSLSLNHHLYGDDTQLFLSFCPPDFNSSVTHLQNALQHISWMAANLLTLNSSKTEFLLIGLQQQLAEIHNCSLNTTDSARNLGFIFDSHLTFSDQISSLSL